MNKINLFEPNLNKEMIQFLRQNKEHTFKHKLYLFQDKFELPEQDCIRLINEWIYN